MNRIITDYVKYYHCQLGWTSLLRVKWEGSSSPPSPFKGRMKWVRAEGNTCGGTWLPVPTSAELVMCTRHGPSCMRRPPRPADLTRQQTHPHVFSLQMPRPKAVCVTSDHKRCTDTTPPNHLKWNTARKIIFWKELQPSDARNVIPAVLIPRFQSTLLPWSPLPLLATPHQAEAFQLPLCREKLAPFFDISF